MPKQKNPVCKKYLLLLLVMCLLFTLCACAPGPASALEDAWPAVDASDYVPLTPALYAARTQPGSEPLAWFEGTVRETTIESDHYGTLYCHLTVATGAGDEFALLHNYTSLPYDFAIGKTYRFYVNLAGARGVLINRAELLPDA